MYASSFLARAAEHEHVGTGTRGIPRGGGLSGNREGGRGSTAARGRNLDGVMGEVTLSFGAPPGSAAPGDRNGCADDDCTGRRAAGDPKNPGADQWPGDTRLRQPMWRPYIAKGMDAEVVLLTVMDATAGDRCSGANAPASRSAAGGVHDRAGGADAHCPAEHPDVGAGGAGGKLRRGRDGRDETAELRPAGGGRGDALERARGWPWGERSSTC